MVGEIGGDGGGRLVDFMATEDVLAHHVCDTLCLLAGWRLRGAGAGFCMWCSRGNLSAR